MGLRNAWAALFTKEEKRTTEAGPKADQIVYFDSPWKRASERKGLWNDLDMMDKENPVVARGLDFTARFATQFVEGRRDDEIRVGNGPELGFKIESPVDRELAILAPLVPKLQANAFEHVRGMIKFGDLFAEVVVDPDAQSVINAKMFPFAYQVNKNIDRYGALLSGDPQDAMAKRKTGFAAYDQTDEIGGLLAAFNKYQIAHFSFGHKQGLQYTEPVLGCCVSRAKRLTAIEDGLSVARLISAYPARVIHIPCPAGLSEDDTRAKVKAVKDTMSTDTTVPYDTATGEFSLNVKNAPLSVDTTIYVVDFYDPNDIGKVVKSEIVNLEAQNPNLENLEDVYLLVRFLLCAIGVPADFLNLAVGQRSFIDKTTPEKREAFLYMCCAVQTAYVTVIRWICDIQLLLNGVNPLQAKYTVVPPRISPREAEVATKIDLTRANTAAIWRNMGIPKEGTGGRILQMTPGEIAAWIASEGTEAPAGKTPEETTEAWATHVRLSYLAAEAAAAQLDRSKSETEEWREDARPQFAEANC